MRNSKIFGMKSKVTKLLQKITLAFIGLILIWQSISISIFAMDDSTKISGKHEQTILCKATID